MENNALWLLPQATTVASGAAAGSVVAQHNEQLAKDISRFLNELGDNINDFLYAKGELSQEAINKLSPEEQRILAERYALAALQPAVKNMAELFSKNEYGHLLKNNAVLSGYDINGEPVYRMEGGAGNHIFSDDQIKLSSAKDALLVYSKEGYFLAALNLDGSKNTTLSDIYRGGSLGISSSAGIGSTGLQTTVAVDPKDMPKLEGFPASDENKPTVFVTPQHERDKDEGKLVNPAFDADKEVGKLPGFGIHETDWRDSILTSEKGTSGSKDSGNQTISNEILDKPRVGYGEKGFGSGNKIDQVNTKPVLDADGRPITVYPGKPKPEAVQEFPSTAKSHGFNDIIDNYAGQATKTILRDGATLHQLEGSLNGVSGRFEWIVDPKLGGVSHRMFVPNGKINGVPSKP